MRVPLFIEFTLNPFLFICVHLYEYVQETFSLLEVLKLETLACDILSPYPAKYKQEVPKGSGEGWKYIY